MKLALLLLIFCSVFVLYAYGGGRPIAHWDMVPYQAFGSPFNVGLVAFHISGLQVDMFINGTKAATLTAMTYNVQSNVWEYWFSINPNDYQDGLLNITAVCTPQDTSSPSFTVPPLYQYTNAQGSFTINDVVYVDAVNGNDTNIGSQASPVKTIVRGLRSMKQGGTLLLQPGYYIVDRLNSLGTPSNRTWTTIKPAPGVSRSQVKTIGGRPNYPFLHFINFTFSSNVTNGYSQLLYGDNNYIWLHDCLAFSAYRDELSNPNQAEYMINYGTTGFILGGASVGVATGPLRAFYVKDHLVDTALGDAWSGSNKLVVNCDVQWSNPGTSGLHPDFFQANDPPQTTFNAIIYNTRAFNFFGQGFFGGPLYDAAFVNIVIQEVPEYKNIVYSQLSNNYTNVLYAHITVINQAGHIRGANANMNDVHFVNNIYQSWGYIQASEQPKFYASHNMFYGVRATEFGNMSILALETNTTNFVNFDAQDYRLATTSPAYLKGKNLPIVPADITGRPHNSASRNIGAYGSNAGAVIFPIRNTSTVPAAFGPSGALVVPTAGPTPSPSSSTTVASSGSSSGSASSASSSGSSSGSASSASTGGMQASSASTSSPSQGIYLHASLIGILILVCFV